MIFPGHPARRRNAGWLLALAMFVAAGSAVLCAQQEGTRKWGPFSLGGVIYSSPAIGPDGTIYVGVGRTTTPSRGKLFAINPTTLQLKWQSELLPDWIESSPAVAADGTIYVGCDDGKLYAFDPNSTGDEVKPKWQFDTKVSIFSSPAIGPDGTIYIGGEDSALHAISPAGTALWSHGVGNWVDSSPAVAPDGTIYFGSWDKNIYALNPDGSEKWRIATGAEVISSPAIGTDGTVYVGSSDGRLYAITREGVTKWTYETGGEIQASPVLAPDGTIYVGSNDTLFYAIKPDGTLRWKGPSGKAIVATAAVRGDGTVIYGSYDGVLRALDPDGRQLWIWPQTAADKYLIEASPVIAPDGTIYVAQADGRLFALHGNGSPLSTFSSWPMFRHDAAHSGRVPRSSSGGFLVNLSTRASAGIGVNLIAGMTVTGVAPKNFLLRGVGPKLADYGVSDFLPDAKLDLFVGQVKVAENDNWGSEGNSAELSATMSAVGAFQFSANSKDAAVVTRLEPGPYTAQITSPDGGNGVALVEAYDANSGLGTARLINLSTRGRVNTTQAMFAGFVIAGGGTARVLLRAIGPGLNPFGVPNVLARPTMNLFSGQTLLASNSGWTSGGLRADLTAVMNSVGAFPITDPADCAMLVTLNSGAYTIQVAGLAGAVGEAIVEVYVVP